jgi:hypothetical protein
MSKLTAVEWLEQKIEKLLPDFIGVWQEEFQQAKAMEREQIIEAAERWKGTNFAEKYYNETYKGGEQ